MIIFVKAKPKSKFEKVEKIDDQHFVVYVKELPEKGKANSAIIKTIAEYLKISPSQIVLKAGEKSKNKIFEVKT